MATKSLAEFVEEKKANATRKRNHYERLEREYGHQYKVDVVYWNGLVDAYRNVLDELERRGDY